MPHAWTYETHEFITVKTCQDMEKKTWWNDQIHKAFCNSRSFCQMKLCLNQMIHKASQLLKCHGCQVGVAGGLSMATAFFRWSFKWSILSFNIIEHLIISYEWMYKSNEKSISVSKIGVFQLIFEPSLLSRQRAWSLLLAADRQLVFHVVLHLSGLKMRLA